MMRVTRHVQCYIISERTRGGERDTHKTRQQEGACDRESGRECAQWSERVRHKGRENESEKKERGRKREGGLLYAVVVWKLS